MSTQPLRLLLLLISSTLVISLHAQLIESEGMIQTTSGGIQFSDGSIQNTSAYHNGPHDASPVHAVGFMQIEGISSELDTLGLTHAIPVYSINFSGEYNVGNGRVSGAPQISAVCVYIEIGRYTPAIWGSFTMGRVAQTAQFQWTRQPSSTYYIYNFENVQFQSIRDELVHIGNDDYAQLQGVCLLPEDIEWVYFDGQRELSASYNIETNTQ